MNKTTSEAGPDLLSGIMEATPSELSLLTRAYSDMLVMHHKGIGEKTTGPLQKLAYRLWQLDNCESVPFIDTDEPTPPGSAPLPNPDSANIREMIVATGRTTLIKGLITCVAMQRRMVTGTPYASPPASATISALAKESPHVRWVTYAPVPENIVEALFYQARENDQPEHKKVVETHDMVRHWQTTVIPAIHRRYDADTHDSRHTATGDGNDEQSTIATKQ